jgi:hypothetical protein
MANMPGKSQEEPSVMVATILCDDPLTSVVRCNRSSISCSNQTRLVLVAKHDTFTTYCPSDFLVEM